MEMLNTEINKTQFSLVIPSFVIYFTYAFILYYTRIINPDFLLNNNSELKHREHKKHQI